MWLGKMRFAVLLVIAALLAVVTWVAYPGTPSKARSLRFVGYIPLRRTGLLNVLDYLTVHDGDLFVASMSSGTVTRIATHGETDARDVRVLQGHPSAHGVAVDPGTGLAFVSRSGVNTIEVFDPAQMISVRSIAVADDPDAILYVPPFGAHPALIYVAHGDSKTATIIDPGNQQVTATIQLGGKAEFAVFDPASGLLFQNLEDMNELIAIDLWKRAITGRWPITGCEGPSGLALDEAGKRLFVACSISSKVVIFDLEKHLLSASYTIAKHPDTIAYDNVLQRVYAAGALGELSVLQGEPNGSFHLADAIHTHLGAHTLAVDATTHRLYLGYVGLFIGARIAVFDAEP